ncbi:hypothetical protein Hdeb2414_s0017g00501691 [Helianthus debilis subsp. tardiflorus]
MASDGWIRNSKQRKERERESNREERENRCSRRRWRRRSQAAETVLVGDLDRWYVTRTNGSCLGPAIYVSDRWSLSRLAVFISVRQVPATVVEVRRPPHFFRLQ